MRNNYNESWKKHQSATRWFHGSPVSFERFESSFLRSEGMVFFTDNPFLALTYASTVYDFKDLTHPRYIYEIETPPQFLHIKNSADYIDDHIAQMEELLATEEVVITEDVMFPNRKTEFATEYLYIYQAMKELGLSPKEIVDYHQEFVSKTCAVMVIRADVAVGLPLTEHSLRIEGVSSAAAPSIGTAVEYALRVKSGLEMKYFDQFPYMSQSEFEGVYTEIVKNGRSIQRIIRADLPLAIVYTTQDETGAIDLLTEEESAHLHFTHPFETFGEDVRLAVLRAS